MSTWKWWILYDFMVNPCKSHPFDGYLDVTINFQVDANEGTETQRGSSLRSAWSTLPCSEEKRFGLLWLFCDCFLYMGDLILYIVFFDSWILAISYLADSIDDCRPLHRIPMFIQVCSVVTLSILIAQVWFWGLILVILLSVTTSVFQEDADCFQGFNSTNQCVKDTRGFLGFDLD